MVRFLSLTTWLCTTLGVALLACSIVLVPDHLALGDEGGGSSLPPTCAGDVPCDSGCTQAPRNMCNRPLVKDCNQNVYLDWCGTCICILEPVMEMHCSCVAP